MNGVFSEKKKDNMDVKKNNDSQKTGKSLWLMWTRPTDRDDSKTWSKRKKQKHSVISIIIELKKVKQTNKRSDSDQTWR